jgi:hypothetical protein
MIYSGLVVTNQPTNIRKVLKLKNLLLEDKRSQLLSRSKTGDPYVPWNQFRGKNRYQRRLYSRLASSVKNFNSIDMNKLFKDDILDVDIDVKGETNVYVVRISFGGFLDELHNFLKTQELNRKIIAKALSKAFNGDQVYINCTCPDFRYRGKYWATKNNILIGAPETRPSNITNPNDTKGPGCKHITLALSDSSWLVKVSSVIYNYIEYMKEHDERLYQKYIYPAIYQKPYEADEIQLDMTDIDNRGLDIRFSEYQELVDDDMARYGKVTNTTKELIADAGLYIEETDKGPVVSGSTLSKANKAAVERGRFKKDNEYRFTKPNKEFEDQVEMELD